MNIPDLKEPKTWPDTRSANETGMRNPAHNGSAIGGGKSSRILRMKRSAEISTLGVRNSVTRTDTAFVQRLNEVGTTRHP